MKVRNIFLKKVLGVAIMSLVLFVPLVYGADLTSTNFIVKDPIVGSGGGFSTSSNFGSYFSGDLTMIGAGSSTSFEGRYGFLWFPYVIKGVFSAVANGPDADLSWGASTSGLGWNVTGYNTGISSVSGGPYTYTDVGLVTSYTYSGLTPGDYCFVLQTYEAFSNVIATSQEECITISPVLTFSISDNTIGFGTLSSSGTRYATGDTLGQGSEPTNAHTVSAATNATDGYTITVLGPTLTSGGNTITSISGGPTALSVGSEQFGIRAVATGGGGSVSSPYNGSSGNFGFSVTPNSPTNFATASAVTTNTTYDVNYATNISSSTEAGNYSTSLTYVITGNF